MTSIRSVGINSTTNLPSPPPLAFLPGSSPPPPPPEAGGETQNIETLTVEGKSSLLTVLLCVLALLFVTCTVVFGFFTLSLNHNSSDLHFLVVDFMPFLAGALLVAMMWLVGREALKRHRQQLRSAWSARDIEISDLEKWQPPPPRYEMLTEEQGVAGRISLGTPPPPSHLHPHSQRT